MEVLYSEEELASKIDYDNFPVQYPAGLLGKAKTVEEYRGYGLNSYMGYLGLSIFLCFEFISRCVHGYAEISSYSSDKEP